MAQPIKDCRCEDFPCCEHADNIPSEEPEYCGICGGYGHTESLCQGDGWYEDEEDGAEWDPGPEVDDEGGMSEVRQQLSTDAMEEPY